METRFLYLKLVNSAEHVGMQRLENSLNNSNNVFEQ